MYFKRDCRKHQDSCSTQGYFTFYCIHYSLHLFLGSYNAVFRSFQLKIQPLMHLDILNPQFSSVAQSCPTLCDPMNRSTPGLPVHHQHQEFTQTHATESMMPSSHLILCRPLSSCPQSFPASGSFPMSQLFAWGGQSTGVSALASFLPKSQGWFPSEWTGWISLQSKGFSRVFSNTTVQKHQFF